MCGRDEVESLSPILQHYTVSMESVPPYSTHLITWLYEAVTSVSAHHISHYNTSLLYQSRNSTFCLQYSSVGSVPALISTTTFPLGSDRPDSAVTVVLCYSRSRIVVGTNFTSSTVLCCRKGEEGCDWLSALGCRRVSGGRGVGLTQLCCVVL